MRPSAALGGRGGDNEDGGPVCLDDRAGGHGRTAKHILQIEAQLKTRDLLRHPMIPLSLTAASF